MDIRIDDLTGPEIAALLREHLRRMHLHTPAQSVHALPIEALRGPGVTFWSAWQGPDLMGCGALKELDPAHGEIKSMRTVDRHLRKGVAAALLDHILAEARRRSYRRLSLETGSAAAFTPALALYEKFGFQRCGPFGEYTEDPFSVYLTMELK